MTSSRTKEVTAVIGVDPGIRGGIAIISSENYYSAIQVPTTVINDKLELDMLALTDYMRIWNNTFFVKRIYFEQVHAMPGQGVSSMFTFGKTYGILIGCLTTVFEVNPSFVQPLAWKKAVLPVSQHYDKKLAIDHCIEFYPNVNLFPGRLRKPHDGMAEAMCIAEYGAMKVNLKDKMV